MTDNGGFGEGSGIFFAFLIFALFAFGGGAWSGWGRNGFNGAGAVAADIGIQSQLDNIQAQNFYNSLNNGIAGIQSDYYKADEAPQYYVERALDFLNDKDAPEGKAKRYYVAMHCMD